MKKFLALTLAAAAALTLAAREVKLGIPQTKGKGWSIFFQNTKGSLTQVDFFGKKCALIDATATKPNIANAASRCWIGNAKFNKVTAIRLTFYTEDVRQLVLRVEDATKQTHQYYFSIKPGSKWQTVTFDLAKAYRKSCFGGAKDKAWHAPARIASVVFDVEPVSRVNRDDPQAKLYVAEFTVIGE